MFVHSKQPFEHAWWIQESEEKWKCLMKHERL